MRNIYRCRLCLKDCKSKIDIFKDDFPRMIQILAGVNVSPDDDFPQKSCLDCARNVKSALKMRKLIIQSHKALLEEFLAKCREENIMEFQKTTHDPARDTCPNAISKRKSCRQENLMGFQNCITNTRDKQGPNAIARRKSLRILKNNPGNDIGKAEELSKKADTTGEIANKNISGPEFNKNEGDVQDDSESNQDHRFDDGRCSDSEWIPSSTPVKTRASPIKTAADGVSLLKKPLKSSAIPSAKIIVRIKKKPKTKSPAVRVACKICNKEVKSCWLQKHMETHEYNPATCEFCGLVSKSATALRHHVFYYHRSAADEYMCDQCARSFRSKYRLNLHKKKEHGGTKDFECTTCGKQFFERMHLKRHVDKTHKNIRPFVCDFCGKCFKSKNHIKIHERIHSKEAPYSCNMCDESFKMKLTLRTHLKGVHNVQEEQKVFCSICGRGFASDVALKAHLNSRIHETEKCQYCSEMFTREYMVNHLRDVHKISDVERENDT